MVRLDEVSNVGRHFFNLCVVKGLNVTKVPHVTLGDEVDGDTLSPESTGSTDTMDVVLTVRGQVVVDHQRHLLHVDASRQQIGGDEDTGGAGAELSHDQITFTLVHVA